MKGAIFIFALLVSALVCGCKKNTAGQQGTDAPKPLPLGDLTGNIPDIIAAFTASAFPGTSGNNPFAIEIDPFEVPGLPLIHITAKPKDLLNRHGKNLGEANRQLTCHASTRSPKGILTWSIPYDQREDAYPTRADVELTITAPKKTIRFKAWANDKLGHNQFEGDLGISIRGIDHYEERDTVTVEAVRPPDPSNPRKRQPVNGDGKPLVLPVLLARGHDGNPLKHRKAVQSFRGVRTYTFEGEIDAMEIYIPAEVEVVTTNLVFDVPSLQFPENPTSKIRTRAIPQGTNDGPPAEFTAEEFKNVEPVWFVEKEDGGNVKQGFRIPDTVRAMRPSFRWIGPEGDLGYGTSTRTYDGSTTIIPTHKGSSAALPPVIGVKGELNLTAHKRTRMTLTHPGNAPEVRKPIPASNWEVAVRFVENQVETKLDNPSGEKEFVMFLHQEVRDKAGTLLMRGTPARIRNQWGHFTNNPEPPRYWGIPHTIHLVMATGELERSVLIHHLVDPEHKDDFDASE